MGAKLGGGGSSKSRDFPDNNEINVTPFVDVMLVLLIIFMIAAPLATVNIKVDLPPSNAEPEPNPNDPVFISIQKTGQIFIMDDEVNLGTLVSVLTTYTKGDLENRLFIRADKDVRYAEVMQVMNTLQDNGYYKLALVAEEVVE